MSDLPPSTIPPDEDQPLSQRSEEDHIADDNKEDEPDKIEEPEEPVDDRASEKADESDHEPEQTVDIDEDVKDEDVKSETAESEQETTEDIEEEQQDLESEKEDQDLIKENENEDDEQMVNNQEDDIHEEGNQEEDRIDENEEEEKEDEILSQKEPDIQKDNEEPEQKEEEDDDEEDDDEEDEEEGHQQSDLEVTVDNKDEPAQENPDDEDTKSEDQEQKQEKEDTKSQKESDTETKQHKHISSDEDDAEVQRRLIGLKKGKDYTIKGALTTVLVSREEEERKRQKINSKSKKQKMKKLAKKKTKRFGGKGIKGDKRQLDSDDEIGSSDDEIRRRGLREAPFMKQYENKKHIEHILDEQHYWSDPEADKDSFRINDEMSSIFNSDFSSDSEEEIIGADGIPVRVKKTKHDKRKKRGDGDDISNADSEYLRQKMLKRAGSVDSMVSVEDPDNIDQRKSKRRLNEHIMKMDIDEDITREKSKSKTGDASGNDEEEADKSDRERTEDDKGKADTVANSKFSLNKTKTILVKEHSDMTDDSLNEKARKSKKKSKRTLYGKENEEDLSDFCDTDIDKLSDRDSGMDEEEGDIDVLLTHDQQQMIVNMLFDEDMNLRPQFSRDENGRIVRRLDNTVVYDPHTGRFTYRKRLGQIFKVPRLKRNDKGRPLGGYIEDEFGPKPDKKPMPRKTSSARRSHSGKSGRFSVDTRLPSSADLKRVRTDGRNVGFSVPDEDIDTIPDDDLEYNKRGRRDIGSAIRRQLNKRLFRKKRKLGSRGSPGTLPEVKVRKAWGDDDHLAPGTLSAGGPGGVSPLNPRSGRFVQGSPWAQRKTPTAGDAEQWQMYRDGLQSDRRILENLQDKLNAGERPFAPKEAFVESGGEINEGHEGHGDELHSRYDRGHSYFTDDGRIGIRERGCPELKQQKVPLFTIIRRPGDLESFENLHGASTTERDVKSQPLQVQDYNAEQADNEQQEGNRYPSDNSLVARSNDGRCSEMTSIDDNRLRRLLEELYKDKKYFDNYVESKDPQSQEFLHSQGLAEHGRGYLLKRADYWERRGPLPPRPPMTAVGWKMQRQQTLAASRQASELGYSTMTCTPDLSTTNMPGVVESPRGNEQISERNESRNSKNESFV